MSNSHIKQYEVLFPSGSSYLSDEVQEQVIKIYNQIPELQYSTINCKGLNDSVSDQFILSMLARNRARELQQAFLQFGMAAKHVKLTYGTNPFILVFKPKAVLRTSSIVTEQLAKHKEVHAIDPSKRAHFISSHDLVYIFAPCSFETTEGTVIKSGEVKIELTELCTNDHVVKCGVVGKQSSGLQSYGLYINVEAFYQGKKLKLRPGYVYKTLVDSRLATKDMSMCKGNVIDLVMIWRTDKHSKVVKKYLANGEINNRSTGSDKTLNQNKIKEGYRTELILNKLGWHKCIEQLNTKQTKKVLVSLDSQKQVGLYLVSSKSKLIIPAVENLNFKNLYEFHLVPKNESFQLVVLPIVDDVSSYVFQKNFDTNLKFSSLESEVCGSSSAYDCVLIK